MSGCLAVHLSLCCISDSSCSAPVTKRSWVMGAALRLENRWVRAGASFVLHAWAVGASIFYRCLAMHVSLCCMFDSDCDAPVTKRSWCMGAALRLENRWVSFCWWLLKGMHLRQGLGNACVTLLHVFRSNYIAVAMCKRTDEPMRCLTLYCVFFLCRCAWCATGACRTSSPSRASLSRPPTTAAALRRAPAAAWLVLSTPPAARSAAPGLQV